MEIAKELREKEEKRTYIVIENRNNIVIRGWEVPKRDLLETAVEEMLKKELKIDAIVVEAFWTRKDTNMMTAKIKDKEQKREIMIKKKMWKDLLIRICS